MVPDYNSSNQLFFFEHPALITTLWIPHKSIRFNPQILALTDFLKIVPGYDSELAWRYSLLPPEHGDSELVRFPVRYWGRVENCQHQAVTKPQPSSDGDYSGLPSRVS